MHNEQCMASGRAGTRNRVDVERMRSDVGLPRGHIVVKISLLRRSICVLARCLCASLPAAILYPGLIAAQAEEAVVRIGARSDTPPMSYKDENGVFRGYTIDICHRIRDAYNKNSEKSPVTFQFVEVNAFNRFELLDAGEISAICGATTITVERMKKYDFSFFTFVSGASVMAKVPTANAFSPRTRTLARTEGTEVHVAVVSDTTTRQRMEELLGTSVILVPMRTHFDALDALESDEVQYYVGDRVILQRVLTIKGTDPSLKLGARFLTYEPYAIPIDANRKDLLLAANEAIADLYRSGDITTLYDSYFPESRPSPMLNYMYQLFSIPTGSMEAR